MPSGAKKRKAAKKRKEKEAINSNPQGNDDSKSQNEKGSDGGEVGSPVHQDEHNHKHQFNEGDEGIEEGGLSAAQSFVTDDKSREGVSDVVEDMQMAGVENARAVSLKRGMKRVEGSVSQDVYIEHVESSKESTDGYAKSSSSSSSDDEYHIAEKKSMEETYNAAPKPISSDSLVKQVDSSSANVAVATESEPARKTVDSVVESSTINVSSDTQAVPLSAEERHVVENVIEKSEVDVANNTPATHVDLALKRDENDRLSLSDKNGVDKNDVASTKLIESEPERSLSSPGSPVIKSRNGIERARDIETPECSENQPLIATAPPVVQKTSWFSCCGLLEFLTGSSN